MSNLSKKTRRINRRRWCQNKIINLRVALGRGTASALAALFQKINRTSLSNLKRHAVILFVGAEKNPFLCNNYTSTTTSSTILGRKVKVVPKKLKKVTLNFSVLFLFIYFISWVPWKRLRIKSLVLMSWRRWKWHKPCGEDISKYQVINKPEELRKLVLKKIP